MAELSKRSGPFTRKGDVGRTYGTVYQGIIIIKDHTMNNVHCKPTYHPVANIYSPREICKHFQNIEDMGNL